MGPGGASLDNALSIDWGIAGGFLTVIIGVISGVGQLVLFYRPSTVQTNDQ